MTNDTIALTSSMWSNVHGRFTVNIINTIILLASTLNCIRPRSFVTGFSVWATRRNHRYSQIITTTASSIATVSFHKNSSTFHPLYLVHNSRDTMSDVNSNHCQKEEDPFKDKDSKKSVKRNNSTSSTTSTSSSKKKKTAANTAALSQTEVTPLKKLFPDDNVTENNDNSSSGYKYKIITWNVAGLRALMKNHPMALSNLAVEHDADVICLQETKLQPEHVYDEKLKMKEILKEEGFKSYFSCCSVKKGYSGTAVFIKQYLSEDGADTTNDHDNASFIKKKKKKQMTLFDSSNTNDSVKEEKKVSSSNQKKKQPSHSLRNNVDFVQQNLIPRRVTFSMNSIHDKEHENDHDPEGRIICVELPKFFFVNLYVPNSGQKLDRLDYRIHTWDKALSQYIHDCMIKWKKPGMWLGDLNVAHKEKDVWNDGAKHLLKQAGCTLEERSSFDDLLNGYHEDDTNHDNNPVFRDVFRTLHPDASGHYSYWSQRAGNRLPNKGLRLDYFVAHSSMFSSKEDDDGKMKKEKTNVVVRDSYMLPNVQGSDHCPCVLELELIE